MGGSDNTLAQLDVNFVQSERLIECSDLDTARPWRSVIDAIPGMAWRAEGDGTNAYHNQAILDYSGFTREEALAAGWSKMIHPQDEHRYSEAWSRTVLAGIPFECEFRLRRSDGCFRWCLNRAQPRHDAGGRVVEWYGTNTDIHDRIMAEQALGRNEAYLSETLRLNRTGTFGWNASTGEIFYWSDEVYEIFDFDRATKPVLDRVLDRFHPDDIEAVLQRLEIAPKVGSIDFRSRIISGAGITKHIHVTAHPVPNDESDLHFLGAVSDISERIRRDELLVRLQADYAHASRVSLLGELTASIAHEIAQPLSAIAANGEAGQRWLNRDEPNISEVRILTDRIVSNVHRANDIISRVRSLATGSALVREEICLDEVIREALTFLRHDIQVRDAQVRHYPAPNPVLVYADRTQMQQVVVNLVLNAMQALRINADRKIFIQTTPLNGSSVQVSIEDTGTGICPEYLPRLFDSFFTTKPGGMGIGLRLCKSIVEAHDGTIDARNRSDRSGARFEFELPVANSRHP